jgi:hypothetical protein
MIVAAACEIRSCCRKENHLLGLGMPPMMASKYDADNLLGIQK